MTMKTMRFGLADVLQITTGIMLTSMDQIYAILNHMTDDNLSTHQLPRAMRQCRPFLLETYPELSRVGDGFVALLNRNIAIASETNGDSAERACSDWVSCLIGLDYLGLHAFYDVPQIPESQRSHVDPMAEAVQIFGADKVVRVAVAPRASS